MGKLEKDINVTSIIREDKDLELQQKCINSISEGDYPYDAEDMLLSLLEMLNKENEYSINRLSKRYNLISNIITIKVLYITSKYHTDTHRFISDNYEALKLFFSVDKIELIKDGTSFRFSWY